MIEKQAALIARWMLVGFVHGVMNTDNMALSGETIDYGPCAFMDAYDPTTVFSSIDSHGRYAYGNQPTIAHWNLTRLAETLLTLMDPEEQTAISMAEESLAAFGERFRHHWLDGMRLKLGLFNEEADDAVLARDLLEWMQRTRADFTNTFARLAQSTATDPANQNEPEFLAWLERFNARLTRQPQSAAESEQLRRAHNPAFIPRNHLVEAALSAAETGDLRPMQRLLEILSAPYDHERDAPEYRSPAPAGSSDYQTFCGT